jgi:hypothetical protein
LRAWQAAGRPAGCEVLETAGEGEHILLWFVNDVAARVLDERVAHWRARIIGERPTPPARGNDVLKRRPA